jgi:hypothetical protein
METRMNENYYPIGTPGKPWGAEEKALWLSQQIIKRSYADEVLVKLEALKDRFNIQPYGALSFDAARYPLYIARSKTWQDGKPIALVTGGVHGYETSGVQGALRFLETHASEFEAHFNLLVAPCISPWGYETINRWNPQAVDPNRSFRPGGASEEARFLMNYLESLAAPIQVHIDLHETTDTDISEFRPALAARDGVEPDHWGIPDGFYLVGESDKPAEEFQHAIIQAVEKITPIAPADEGGGIIGEPLQQWGVIYYAGRKLGLCMGITVAPFVTTTEVYPDSPKVDAENCILAQVTAVVSGLEFVRAADIAAESE